MAILNYTTLIPPQKTLTEIQAMLVRQKANQIAVDYDDEGHPSALRFRITFAEQPIFFRLPCNIAGVHSALGKAKVPAKFRTMDQARRVAWRIIKDWVEAQLAIVEAGQSEMAEVFLPYALDPRTDETFFQVFGEQKRKQLAAQN